MQRITMDSLRPYKLKLKLLLGQQATVAAETRTLARLVSYEGWLNHKNTNRCDKPALYAGTLTR